MYSKLLEFEMSTIFIAITILMLLGGVFYFMWWNAKSRKNKKNKRD